MTAKERKKSFSVIEIVTLIGKDNAVFTVDL